MNCFPDPYLLLLSPDPDGVLPPTLLATGPTSIQATWTEPARNNAPGDPSFQLRYRLADQPGNQIE